MLDIREERIGRVCKHTSTDPRGGWLWFIHCVTFWDQIDKPAFVIQCCEPTTRGGGRLVAAWERERAWRPAFRQTITGTHGCWPPLAVRIALTR